MTFGHSDSSRLDAHFSSSRPINRALGNGMLNLVDEAVVRTRDWLIARQSSEGYWVGELEGDTILESEYILLLAFLGQGQSAQAKEATAYLLAQQNPDGGWSAYPGGPTEISGAAKAYLALKITGHSPEADYMQRARAAVLKAGGVEQVNSFTRYYFAMLGLIPYELCPAVPPELVLLPHGCPFNVYEMSAWSRTILVPLSLLWAFRPCRPLPAEHGFDELYLSKNKKFPRHCGGVNHEGSRGFFNWTNFFRWVDSGIKLGERMGLTPLRQRAVKKAEQWILDRLRKSDGLGAIFPPIIWTIIGLKSIGYPDDSPVIASQFVELEKLFIREKGALRLQPCLSPVWDTVISIIALREAGVPPQHEAIRKSVRWILSKEVREKGDWSLSHPQVEPGGWYFEFNNEFYPDVDDTCMAIIALTKALPNGMNPAWKVQLEFDAPQGNSSDPTGNPGHEVQGVLSGRSSNAQQALEDLGLQTEMLDAMRRGVQWLKCMQSRDGGWGAFDSNNTRELFTKVPFADHNAMIDPSTADITARVLESFAGLGLNPQHPVIQNALRFIMKDQCPDGAWFGRWGVNYIYGTWQVLVGLAATGVPHADPRIQKGVAWLKSKQQGNGGWGETIATYDNPSLRGTGNTTASQTAWALLGLIAAGEAGSEAAQRGAEFLIANQLPNGTWDEPEFTGTGFPRVFYLKYHLYRIYFPLMALARYRQAISKTTGHPKSA